VGEGGAADILAADPNVEALKTREKECFTREEEMKEQYHQMYYIHHNDNNVIETSKQTRMQNKRKCNSV
jgi:cytidylate kinase